MLESNTVMDHLIEGKEVETQTALTDAVKSLKEVLATVTKELNTNVARKVSLGN